MKFQLFVFFVFFFKFVKIIRFKFDDWITMSDSLSFYFLFCLIATFSTPLK